MATGLSPHRSRSDRPPGAAADRGRRRPGQRPRGPRPTARAPPRHRGRRVRRRRPAPSTVIDGIEATRQLTELHPAVAIVVLTTYADDTSILAALSAGARSYLTKDADRVEIASALRSAVSGLSVLDPTVRAALLAAATRSAPAHEAPPALPEVLPDGLTRREAEILAMMARGMTNPDIAAQLYLSAHTIKSHINRIFAKTGSADRAAAVRYALDQHLA